MLQRLVIVAGGRHLLTLGRFHRYADTPWFPAVPRDFRRGDEPGLPFSGCHPGHNGSVHIPSADPSW